MTSGIRMLVVDDEERQREVISEVLTDNGHEVSTAENGEQALEMFQEDPYPLVITDLRMPGMSGIDLLHKLKEIDSETQVIIMTSHASLETAVSAIRAGAYDYLMKPFEDLNLISTVVHRAVDKIRLTIENQVLVERLRNYNEELEQVNKVLRELAIRDGLTGLYNHRYFQEALSMEVARSRRHARKFSLIFTDIDHFKAYNDAYGHPQGDELLRVFGNILKARLRKSDTAARYGGEEFVLLLPETAQEGALAVAQDLSAQVAEYPFHGREHQPTGTVTISLGVTTFPDHGTEAATIIHRADQALYEAKRNGRNQIVLSS